LNGGAVSWKTKKQDTIALSSTEAEYIALSEAMKEAIWIRRLLREVESQVVTRPIEDTTKYHFKEISSQWGKSMLPEASVHSDLISDRPQVIRVDNQACIALAENEHNRSRAKHIDIRYHFVKDAVMNGKISLVYEPTESMTADVMTKPLARVKHWMHTKAMGITTL
jgi:KUP system potassium uptake protein